MVCITSISPKHHNNDIQLKAVQSWQSLGLNVVSVNSKSECEYLAPNYPGVRFVETNRTMELTYSKPLIGLNTIMDWCKMQQEDNYCIINSDIELKTDSDTIERIKLQMNDNIVLANRLNYSSDHSQGQLFLAGIDVFFIQKKFMYIYPQSVFALGQCFWDYWIPYTAIHNNIPVKFIKQNIAYHKEHPAQYSSDAWQKIGRYFQWETNLYQFNTTKEVGKMSTYVYNFIYSNSKRVEI